MFGYPWIRHTSNFHSILPSDFQTKNVVMDFCELWLIKDHHSFGHKHTAKLGWFVFAWSPLPGWCLAKPSATTSSTTTMLVIEQTRPFAPPRNQVVLPPFS